MNRLVRKILGYLPRRRRRLWRYVSPRRRGAGVLLLALLVVAAWGYWGLTNDDRVRRQARGYLRGLCGGKVEIGRGHFSPFGGIELSDVRLHAPGSTSPEPFLRAKRVILRHGPWRLFVTGTLQPTEVICLEPVVTLEHNVQTDRYNFEAFFKGPGGAARWGAYPPVCLPPIRIRQGSLRWVDVDDRLRIPFEALPVALSMIPKDNTEYLVTFEEQRHGQEAAISGKFVLNVQTGAFRIIYGAAPIPNLDKALPGKYRQWRQRYGISGEVRLTSLQEGSGQSGQMECELVGVSLRLPPEEGGLDLVGVDGAVSFDQGGVTLKNIRGRAHQAGDARFEISGRYEGFDPNSPFDLRLQAWSVTAPSGPTIAGELGRVLKAFEGSFEVSGRMNLAAQVKRLPEGKTVFEAQLEPLGMSVTFKPSPYRLDDLRGSIVVNRDQAELRQLKARRQEASFAFDGVVGLGGFGGTDITVQASDVLLEAQLRDALPERARRIWDQNNPTGRLSGQARIQCNEKYEVEHYQLNLEAYGRASVCRYEFPYRVDNLVGKVRVSDGFVSIEQLRAGRGPMRCVINGTCRRADTNEPDSDITVEVRRLPLDGAMLAAMPQDVRGLVESLHAAGQADSATVKLTQIAGGETHYDIRAMLGDARFKPDKFPYELTGAAGNVEIRPGLVEVKGLTGRHGPSTIVVSGQAFIGQTVGLDLDVKAQAVALDQELFDALPSRAKDIWRRLSPSGAADVDMHMVHETPQRPGQTDYRLVVSPKDARIRYEGFPYAFGGVKGMVLATPSRIDIEGLGIAQGAMRGSLSGSIILTPGGEQVDLRVWAKDVPISQELIAAMPSEMSVLVDRFSPGGTCDVDLSRLSLTPAEQPTAAAPVSAATAAASSQDAAAQACWSTEGSIRFKDAVVTLDFGQRTMSGTVSGSAGRDHRGLRLNADIALTEVMLGRRRLTDVGGRLTKAAAGTIMRIDDLSAKVHGGRATGFAEIRLSQPPQYGLRLSVEDVQLGELFSSGAAQPQTEPEVAGLLTGNIEMTATAGRPESRQASGLLKITKGRIYKLPVLMGFIHVIYLWVPGKAAFTEGEVAYRIQGQRLIFDEIFLRGPALSVVGSGTMNMNNEALDLTFLTGPPGKLPRIAAIESLLKGLAREIAEIRVTGTLARPLPQTVSLPGLDEAVRRLLTPAEQ